MLNNFFNNLTTVNGIIEIGVHLIIIFMILPIHEFAHAFVAYKMGDTTAYYKGRLTINPLAHIDPIGAICLFFTGFGWAKPVPINPVKFKKYRAGIALCALAGPLSNLIVGFIGMIAYRAVWTVAFSNSEFILTFMSQDSAMYYVLLFLQYFVVINIGLAIFNLIPIPPLDGSKILSYFTSAKFDYKVAQYQQYIYIGFIILMFSGILDKPLYFLRELVYSFFVLLTNWVPTLVKIFI